MLLSKETSLFNKDAVKEDIQAAAQKATSYITKVSNDGIFVHQTDAGKSGDSPTQSTAYGVHISDDIDIIQGGESVAAYGTNTRIGKETEGNVLIDNDSVDIRDGQNVRASFGEKAVIGPLKDHARLEILRNETTDPGTFLQMKAINSANQVFGDIYFIADSVNAIPSYFRVKPVDGVGRDAAITMMPGADPTVSVYENLDAASIKRRVWFNNRENSTTVSPIGTVKTDSVASTSISCTSEYKTITAVKLRLDAGVWLVVGSLVFSGGTGQRIVRLATSADSNFASVTVHTALSTRVQASSSGTTKPIGMAIINVTNEESAQSLTDLFVACQGYSSASCTISAVYLQAVKIF